MTFGYISHTIRGPLWASLSTAYTHIKMVYLRRIFKGARRKAVRVGSAIAAAGYMKANASTRRDSYSLAKTYMRPDPGTLTTHNDSKTDYSKRRLTKKQRFRQRRRYKRTRRMVNTVRNFNVGSTHIVRRSLALVSSPSNGSFSVTYGIYGLNGTPFETNNTTNDIGEFLREISPTDWNNTNSPTVVGQNHRLYCYHATAEYTLRNNSNDDVLVEAYFIRGKQPLNAILAANPTDLYNNGFNKEQRASDPNTGNQFDTALSSTIIGVTPFQNAMFCRYFNIYKRQKYTIQPQSEVSFVITDRRVRSFTMDSVRTFSTDRNYHGVLFQQQGVPDASSGVETAAKPSVVTYMCARRYRLKMFRDNLPKSSFEVTDP